MGIMGIQKKTGGNMKKSIFFAAPLLACLLFFSMPDLYAQNSGGERETASSEQADEQTGSFSITTDPSQIPINISSSALENSSGGAPSMAGLFIRMILALAVVAGIVYVIFYFLKRTTRASNDSDPFLRRVSQISLSPGKSVQVVTLQDNAFLIGVSDDSISLIGKIEDKELINAMNLYADKNQKVSKPRSFREILDMFMPGSSKEPEDNIYSQQASSSENAIRRQRERLNSEISENEEN